MQSWTLTKGSSWVRIATRTCKLPAFVRFGKDDIDRMRGSLSFVLCVYLRCMSALDM